MNDTPHEFANSKCINCYKSIQELFFELVDKSNPDAAAYCYYFSTGGSYSDAQAASIVKNNSRCLSEDELNIKDIIE